MLLSASGVTTECALIGEIPSTGVWKFCRRFRATYEGALGCESGTVEREVRILLP